MRRLTKPCRCRQEFMYSTTPGKPGKFVVTKPTKHDCCFCGGTGLQPVKPRPLHPIAELFLLELAKQPLTRSDCLALHAKIGGAVPWDEGETPRSDSMTVGKLLCDFCKKPEHGGLWAVQWVVAPPYGEGYRRERQWEKLMASFQRHHKAAKKAGNAELAGRLEEAMVELDTRMQMPEWA